MQQYRAILLDLDDTLYSYDTAHQAGMNALYEYVVPRFCQQKTEAEAAFKQAREQVHKRLHATAAMHHRLLYMQGLCEILNINPFIHASEFTEVYWSHFLNAMTLYPNAREFLKKWRSKGNKILLLTDLVADIQFRKIIRLQLQDDVDFMVTSEEAGHEKPHVAMFTLALLKLQLPKEQVVMIGDHLEKDYKGAKQFGIDAIWFSAEANSKEGIKGESFTTLLEKIA
jgi:HAD superfamily hydrolase (TIGR01509 family)